MAKITRVVVTIEYDDTSSTFQHFTKPEGAQDWLNAFIGEVDTYGDEKIEDSEKRSDLEADNVTIEK